MVALNVLIWKLSWKVTFIVTIKTFIVTIKRWLQPFMRGCRKGRSLGVKGVI